LILSSLRMSVLPEKRSALLETVKGLLEPARVEKGCLSYRFYEDVENRNAFVLLEEWETEEDLSFHISKESQWQILVLMDLLSEQPEWRFHTVSHTAGMERIENIRRRMP